jgi:hypothetical protein
MGLGLGVGRPALPPGGETGMWQRSFCLFRSSDLTEERLTEDRVFLTLRTDVTVRVSIFLCNPANAASCNCDSISKRSSIFKPYNLI